MTQSTLITELILHTTKESAIHMKDVPTRVESRGFLTELQFNGPNAAATVRLSGAERIALIELLGGEVKHD